MVYVTDIVARVRSAYGYLASKKYTTLAGTMAFFLVLSIVPFLFWLTLIFGRLNIDYDQIFDLEIFAGIRDFLFYLRDSAKSATVGASRHSSGNHLVFFYEPVLPYAAQRRDHLRL